MSIFLETLRQRKLLCDGAMGSSVLAQQLCQITDSIDALTLTHPNDIRSIHESFLQAGADVIQTNTFCAAPHTLKRFGLENQTYELNRRAGELAREAIGRIHLDTPRFVLGSIGPGFEKLDGLQAWEDSYASQAEGLIAGGVDGFLIETCSDPAQIEAAVKGARRAMKKAQTNIPLLVQCVSPNIDALAKAAALQVDVLGFNCSADFETLSQALGSLRESWPGLISLQPSAGMPVIVEGPARYPVTPTQIAEQMQPLVAKHEIHLIGGCCGTTPDHIGALRAVLTRMG